MLSEIRIMKYLVQEKTKTVITCFQTEILCVSPCLICYGCHWYLHEPMGTHANWRATVWWSQWQLFTMIIIQLKMTPSRKYRHHFCFYLFTAIVSQLLKEIYLIQDIFINFNGSLFCDWRFLLNQSVIFLC